MPTDSLILREQGTSFFIHRTCMKLTLSLKRRQKSKEKGPKEAPTENINNP